MDAATVFETVDRDFILRRFTPVKTSLLSVAVNASIFKYKGNT
jgi:hypothetical protein